MQAKVAAASTVQRRRWTRDEYERLAEVDLLRPAERIELIEGDIVEVPPQPNRHARGVCLANDVLRAVLGAGFTIRVQLPLALGEYSEP
jgi:Uma2 family endonuclease